MTLSAKEFRKKPLSSFEVTLIAPLKSCLKNINQTGRGTRGDDDDDNNYYNKDSQTTPTTTTTSSSSSTEEEEEEEEDTESSFRTSSSSFSSSSFFEIKEISKNDDILNNNKSKFVSFGRIEVREFPIILGDNPSPIDGGIPITIGWKPQRRGFFETIDHYEQRYDNDCPLKKQDRRYGNQLLLDTAYRTHLALCGGATLAQIGQTAVAITKIQKHRAQSSQDKKNNKMKGPLKLLLEAFLLDRTNNLLMLQQHSQNQKPKHQKQHSLSSSSLLLLKTTTTTFTRVPNDAPRILSAWKANGDRNSTYCS